eukprot:scaffold53945_cov75-Phaeocystis_antarctica.AAC.5
MDTHPRVTRHTRTQYTIYVPAERSHTELYGGTRAAQQLPLSPLASSAGGASAGEAVWHRAASRLLAARLAAPLAAARRAAC